MKTQRFVRRIRVALSAIGLAVILTISADHSEVARAQTTSAQAPVELEAVLFIQDPAFTNGKAAIHVLWIPQPLQKLCIGKTDEQCSTIDYCIRTTNKNSSQCRNIGVDLSRIPPYPRGMRPRRLLSVVYYPLAPIGGMAKLQDFYHSVPTTSLHRISMDARIRGRIRFTRTADDDDFDLLEVLAVSPF